MPYIGETSLQLEKELRNVFRIYLKEHAQLSPIHKTHRSEIVFNTKTSTPGTMQCGV